MISPNDFIGIISEMIDEKSKSSFLMATMGLPEGGDSKKWRILFPGETQISTKAYSHLSSYQPQSGDTVLLARVNNTYVILGKIEA